MEDIPASAVINSFEVLSDRISTAEEEIAALRKDVSTLLERKVRKELTAYGPLDNFLLGIPCQMVRVPGHHNWDRPYPRSDRMAQWEVTSVVIRFDNNDLWDDDIRRKAVPEAGDPASCFTDWEQEKAAASQSNGPLFLRGTGIRSAHADADCAHMQRVIDRIRREDDYPELSKCIDLHMVMPYETLAFVVNCSSPRPMLAILKETLKLARRICADIIFDWSDVEVTISDCDPHVARYFIAASKFCFSGNDEEVAEAKQVMEGSLRDIRERLLEHPFFNNVSDYDDRRLWEYPRS